MSEPTGDPLLLPTWLQVVVTGGIAVVSGMVGAASTAILVALGINKKFSDLNLSLVTGLNDLRQHVDRSDSQRAHTMTDAMATEFLKSDGKMAELSRRIGACEQDIAILRDFKERTERQEASALREIRDRIESTLSSERKHNQ